jgi:hypothetical protein
MSIPGGGDIRRRKECKMKNSSKKTFPYNLGREKFKDIVELIKYTLEEEVYDWAYGSYLYACNMFISEDGSMGIVFEGKKRYHGGEIKGIYISEDAEEKEIERFFSQFDGVFISPVTDWPAIIIRVEKENEWLTRLDEGFPSWAKKLIEAAKSSEV